MHIHEKKTFLSWYQGIKVLAVPLNDKSPTKSIVRKHAVNAPDYTCPSHPPNASSAHAKVVNIKTPQHQSPHSSSRNPKASSPVIMTPIPQQQSRHCPARPRPRP